MRSCCALLLLALALPRAAAAAPADTELLRIDPAATRVEFSLRLLLIRKLEGRFPLVDGSVQLDRVRDVADIDVRIDAREVMMERPDYAEWARSPEFFDALRHPWITFRARGVPLVLFRDGGTLHGALTLRGHTRPVSMELLPSPCEEPGRRCPVLAEGALERSEFGMTARRFVLGDKVRLRFEIRVLAGDTVPAERPG